MIRIPAFFHEIFGEVQSRKALFVVMLFTGTIVLLAGIFGYGTWSELTLVKQLVLFVLIIDIAGGVVANVTPGTNRFYEASTRRRWVFIAIHVQPIILAWALELPLMIGIGIWAFTTASAVLLNVVRGQQEQPLVAFALAGIGFVLIAFSGIAPLAAGIFLLYVCKVLISFSISFTKEASYETRASRSVIS
ncbi:hypothetical protein ACFO4L_01125 [Bacillus daqingensis]|uniref:Uncharacterized protein n=1 Tax=Bacillus daqingensis TaxID=872396 RepID=A0ABV9NP84_9BACI